MKRQSYKNKDLVPALGFLLPNFIGFLLFVAFPIIFSFALVFTNWSLKPAIEPRFIGLQNIWDLVGFRLSETPGASEAGLLLLLSVLYSYGLVFAGVITSLLAIGRQWPGVKTSGLIGILTGIVLMVGAIAGPLGDGSALLGVTLIFGFFFVATSEASGFWGKGMTGGVLLVAGLLAIYILSPVTFEFWEPNDSNFYFYLYNTVYMMVVIPLAIAGSLLLALVLSEPVMKTGLKLRVIFSLIIGAVMIGGICAFWMMGDYDYAVLWGIFWGIASIGALGSITAFRTLFYIPTFTAGIAVMLLWKQVFNPDFGPLNEGLRAFGLLLGYAGEMPGWLNDPRWSKPALMLMTFWTVVGGQNMLLYLAGLSNIPQELYEAASIDGASKLQSFWNVTWPQLAPTTFFIVIMSTIAGLQGGFEQARVMTQGGPAGTTKTLAYYIYEKGFEQLELGYASSIAWVMFLMIFLLTALNWRFGNRYVNY